jgi:alpha-amylase
MIAAMVGFRRLVAGMPIDHWWDNGANAIAFGRGGKGFVAISREGVAVSATIATGMPPGTYCDLLTGGRSGTACVGTSIVVDAAGMIPLQLAPNSGLAIDAATRL